MICRDWSIAGNGYAFSPRLPNPTATATECRSLGSYRLLSPVTCKKTRSFLIPSVSTAPCDAHSGPAVCQSHSPFQLQCIRQPPAGHAFRAPSRVFAGSQPRERNANVENGGRVISHRQSFVQRRIAEFEHVRRFLCRRSGTKEIQLELARSRHDQNASHKGTWVDLIALGRSCGSVADRRHGAGSQVRPHQDQLNAHVLLWSQH